MSELLALSIGLGLVVSLLLAEALGVASAGLVVPGYVALYLMRPAYLATTLAATLVTYAALRGLSSIVILYGRRRTAIAILIGYLVGTSFGYLASRHLPGVDTGDTAIIGYVIPGLVALWMDRQGIVETLSALAVTSVAVRLVLLLLFGAEVPT